MEYRVDTMYYQIPFIVYADKETLAEKVLLDACRYSGIEETQYFGLKCNCSPAHDWTHRWVNPRAPLAEQICSKQSERPRKLHLAVKFFVEAHILQLPATRWCFYLDAREAFLQMRLQLGAANDTLSELAAAAIKWADDTMESFELRHQVAVALAAHRNSVGDGAAALLSLQKLVGTADNYTTRRNNCKDVAHVSLKTERGKLYAAMTGSGQAMSLSIQTRQLAALQVLSQLVCYGSAILLQVENDHSVSIYDKYDKYVTYATVTMHGLALLSLTISSKRRSPVRVFPLSAIAVVSQDNGSVSVSFVQNGRTVTDSTFEFMTTEMADCLTEYLVEMIVFHEYYTVPTNVLQEMRLLHPGVPAIKDIRDRPRFGITCTKQEAHECNMRRFLSGTPLALEPTASSKKINPLRCCICLKKKRFTVTLLPCKHRGVCMGCSAIVHTCPTCLREVSNVRANSCCTVS